MYSSLIILIIIILILSFAAIKKTNAYEAFVRGAKEGLEMTVNIFPYILTFTLCSTMLLNCGILDLFSRGITILGNKYPNIIIIQIVIRLLSSSSSLVIVLDIFNDFGVDSAAGILATFIHNSSDAALYVLMFFLGSVGIVKHKYAFKLVLINYLLGIVLAIIMVILLFN